MKGTAFFSLQSSMFRIIMSLKSVKKLLLIILIIISIPLLSGCRQKSVPAPVTENKDTGASSSDDDISEKLEAVDTVIVVDVNTTDSLIILQNSATGTRYELSYDGRTEFFDKYGQAVAAMQIAAGDIADIRLSVHSGYLKSLQISADTFALKNVKNYSFNPYKHMLSVGSDNYRLPDRLVVISSGQVGDVSDICEGDILTIRGIDRRALTATVESGHGYLKIRGEESFVGGWAEIADLIVPVREGMLLTVPEGTYDLRITYKGKGGTVGVTVERDKETSVDISPLKDELLQLGSVRFDITPANAKLYINNEETEYILPVELEYGVYRVRVEAAGYLTFDRNISVGKKEADLKIELESDSTKEDSSSSSERKDESSSASGFTQIPVTPDISSASSTSSSSMVPSSSSSSDYSQEGTYYDDKSSSSSSSEGRGEAYLFVNEPYDVEVYLDGSYKGISPIGIRKEPGTHVITLRRDGYVTKSYTVTLSDNNEDENFDFRELKEE